MDQSFMNSEGSFGKDPPLSECPEPIAIVGMSCRWPGGVHNSSQLWKLLKEKRSGFSEFKKEQINVDGFYHPVKDHPGSFHMRGGFYLKEDPKLFDNNLFKINAIETRTMDPAQRKLLEVTYEAFENAGEPWENFSGSKTGVFVGNFMSDHQNMQFRDPDNPMPYVTTGGDIAIHSNRINYVFNLKGPSLTLDTACSSAMYALHIAVSGIRNGDCDSAIVAGSNLISDPGPQMFITKLGALSPTSTCHTFDAAADGYARAEGVGALYIMPLSRAVAGSYPIRAVIRGTAINANGTSEGISYPSPSGQEAVIRQAYQSAGGLDPALTGYFEAHGTGTPVGDPIEVSAIGRVFAQHRDDENPLLIGSIKPNLGHSESASAIASIMKAVMAIEKGQIPPTRGITKFNPRIDFRSSRTKVVQEMTPWPTLPIRRASVNSFGYGGANAHVILDHIDSVLPGYSVRIKISLNPAVSLPLSYDLGALSTTLMPSHAISENPSRRTSVSSTAFSSEEHSPDTSGSEFSQVTASKAQTTWTPKRLVLLPFSANDDKALQSSIQSLSSVADDYEISQLAHTLASRRSRFPQRTFIVTPCDAVSSSLRSTDMISVKIKREPKSRIGFIFTGQGAQWSSMGRGLLNEYKTFQESIRYQDQILARLSKKPPWRIEDILTDDNISHMINEPMVSQTVCTALQIALVELLSSWGISPSATVGHSSGEIAASYAAGRLTAAEAIVLAWFRGLTVAKNEKKGTMLAVGLSSTDIKSYITNLEADIKIAASNSPKSVTLSGETAAIQQVAAQLEEEGIFNRILKTGGNAYHSHHMHALGSLYEHDAREGLEEIADLVESQPDRLSTLWVSSVTPEKSTKDIETGPSYWRQNLESPVLFDSAVEQLVQQSTEGLDILLEIGPHPALAGPVKQIMQVVKARGSKIPIYIGSLVRGKDDLGSMLEMGGNLFVQNASVNIDALNGFQNLLQTPQPPPVCLDLPNYPYNYGPILFHENRLNKEWRLRKHLKHDLLGSRQLGGTSICPSWRNMFRLRDVPWLGDHRLIPQAIFPAAGFLAMAVEAAFQCHTEAADAPAIAGYSFRNVRVWSTLEVPDTEVGTDVVTNVQKTASSSWYEFKISSLNDKTELWIEHCTGNVKIEISGSGLQQTVTEGEEKWRSMSMKEWYTKFAALGLEYGPSFQGLSNLKSAKNHAAANVELAPTKDAGIIVESTYTIHPAALDNLLQLANIAAYSGSAKLAKQAYIPVMFDNLTIWNRQDLGRSGAGYAVAEGELRGSRGMYSSIQLFTPSGEILVDMNYFKGISYDGVPLSTKNEEDRPQDPFSRLVWKPDITNLSNAKARELFPISDSGPADEEIELLEKLDKLSAYLIVTVFTQFQDTSFFSSEQDHLKYFMDWILRGHAKAASGDMRFGIEAVTATPETRSDVVEALFADLSNLVEAKLIRRIFKNISAIFSAQTTGLEIALEDNLLVDLYTSGRGVSSAYPRVQDMVDMLAHKNPRMKILEIGAGTGGATGHILEALEAESPFKRYQEYRFTDLTPSFLSAAQEKFAASRGLTYSILDIELDPLEQGLPAGEYDLIVASQVLHATSSLALTLRNVRKLLKPGGKLLLLEFTKTHPVSTFVLGTFPYYWNGVADGRVNGPLVGRDRWNTELLQNGFSGIDIILGDNDSGLESASIIIATAIEQNSIPPQVPTEQVTSPGIFIITLGEPTAFASSVAEQLRLTGYEQPSLVNILDYEVPKGARVISLVDIERVANMFEQEVLYNNVKKVLTSASSILWVSSGNIIQSSDPAAGLTVGLLKTVAREMPHLRIAQLSFDSKFDGSLEFARQVRESESRLHLQNEDLAQMDDIEIFQDGCIHISRLIPDTKLNTCYKIQEELDTEPRMEKIGTLGPIKVTTARPGILSTLQFEEDADMLGVLPDDWIEIKSEAIDVNVKDIAVTTGRFDLDTCSTACCGIVTRVGSHVKHIQLGDRVCGFAPGNFGNFVRVPAIYQQRMELTDKPTDLASLPISYMTALYALKNLAHIEKGESVLIQSATGALGLATLRIARHLDADIYVTVGNADKVELLEREFGIPRDRIFSSRELDTPKKIWSATGNRGIDVILCSTTSGEQMIDFWTCIAPLGRFIEVGRLDVINHGKLPMEVFKRNATFSSFDISLVSKQKPHLGAALMAEVVQLYRQGVVKPIDYITTFDISDLQQAMMHMSKGTHVGKIIITYDNPESKIKVAPSSPRPTFDPKATYVLVGCVAGLGNSISNWMIDRGARSLAYLSRSGPDVSDAKDLIKRMAERSVEATVIKCDVTIKSEVEAAIERISSQRPIKGVIQAAAVFEDVSFEALEYSQLQKVLGPKVSGTVNLHEATLHQPLDFFTMTSSIVSVIGTATQASYSAANSFQDAFARFRLAQGLPAQSFALGMILDVGFASSRQEIQRSLTRNGVYGTSELDFVQLLDSAFTAQSTWPNNRFDSLAGAHLLAGLEPRKIYEVDKNGAGADFAWSSDLRFGRVLQAIRDHHEVTTSADSIFPTTATSASAVSRVLSLAQKVKSASTQAPEDIQRLRNLASSAVADRLTKLLFVSYEDVDIFRDMASYGIDSMISAELRNWLFKTFGLEISFVELVGKGVTIEELSFKVVERLIT
ncbi:hypothetical protein K504DRAFT_460398 [Pleomassaria siparia CBS 279.74]|uniref:Uncharacterized protein n=1 Tax=Pleomassaria siparia CBS 279.74 TaxID=1314801 RepID=A0A6G1JYY3_9PLEO|nr:hypothetical protein K504DRAFT_460398 [Pleomassaria siparia CBS 279.74]